MDSFGEALGVALRKALRVKGLTIEAAAHKFGVSRQSFHSYLNGKLPRRKRIPELIRMFDLTLEIKNNKFDKRDFEGVTQETSTEKASQLDLWGVLDSIAADDLKVNVKRVGKVLSVSVRIDIPA